ncbi:unnamed protein product, partial [Prorocentrum cordatum]
ARRTATRSDSTNPSLASPRAPSTLARARCVLLPRPLPRSRPPTGRQPRPRRSRPQPDAPASVPTRTLPPPPLPMSRPLIGVPVPGWAK